MREKIEVEKKSHCHWNIVNLITCAAPSATLPLDASKDLEVGLFFYVVRRSTRQLFFFYLLKF